MNLSKNWWAGWTLARRLRIVLLTLSAALLLSGLVLVAVLRQADRALSYQVGRTFPARIAASQLLTSLVDQETGLRGYALTGYKRFLEPYRQGLISEGTIRKQLDGLVHSGDPARLALLTVDAAITAWRDQYASLNVANETRSSESGAGGSQTLDFGKALFDRVRQKGLALDTQLVRQSTDAQKDADRDRHLLVLVLSVMAVVLLTAVFGLQNALRTAVLRPMNRLAAQVAVVSRGDHGATILPEGPPDIRDMAAGVESMRLQLVGVLAEVEVQRRNLERRASELARSNGDLEQFAYVASHDLQEPLRKVASFCQLLERRYAGQLDERADQYIAFAVDGAKRMQLLINDLLTFSRVGRTTERFVSLDLKTLIAKAWNSMDDRVHQSSATLELDLDTCNKPVQGDPALLQMLLTNLIGNALKYRRPDVSPAVRIAANSENQMLRVSVSDNGIGIPDEYAEKVFVIFQRLHPRDEYEGTGIGLALARKVVEFHGGTIGLLPSPDGGTCVSFTLPFEEIPTNG